MAELLMGVISGTKLALSIVILVYSILAEVPLKKKLTFGLQLFAVMLMIMSISEFIRFLAAAGEPSAFIFSNESFGMLSQFALLAAAASMMIFLNSVRKNQKLFG